MAGLLGAGSVLVQSDLAYERYDQPIPQLLWQELENSPTGLGAPVAFGAPGPDTSLIPMVSEQTLAASADLAAKIRAILDHRFHVSREDIQTVAPMALRHRLILNFEGQAENIAPDDIINNALEAVEATALAV